MQGDLVIGTVLFVVGHSILVNVIRTGFETQDIDIVGFVASVLLLGMGALTIFYALTELGVLPQ